MGNPVCIRIEHYCYNFDTEIKYYVMNSMLNRLHLITHHISNKLSFCFISLIITTGVMHFLRNSSLPPLSLWVKKMNMGGGYNIGYQWKSLFPLIQFPYRGK